MQENLKKYIEMREKFYEKYQNKIVPTVQKYEHKRKKSLYIVIAIICLFCILATVLLFVACQFNLVESLGKLIMLMYVAPFIIAIFIKKNFENSIKQKIMPTVCRCIGNLKWSNGTYKKSSLFLSSCIIPKFTREYYDDIFKGSYEDVNLEIIECSYDVGTGKNRRTVFDGVIVKLDMNKNFASHTVISPNVFLHHPPSSDLHFTELEDVEFNKKFDVFTNDEVEARYLITPSFMERLKNMKVAFNASNVKCAFWENYLLIGLETKRDLFSICSLIKPIADEKQYVQMFEEMVSIVRLIDHFKLNQKTKI